jgi:hypothetical protein
MTDHGHAYDYPSVVRLEVNDDKIKDYAHAADVLNAGQFDVVCLQHEFGIFGGEAGAHIMALLSRLNMPIVTTFHTVLSEPTPTQRHVFNGIVGAAGDCLYFGGQAAMARSGANRWPETAPRLPL